MWVWGQCLLCVCSADRFVSEALSFSVPCCCQHHHSLECDGLVLFLTTCRCHEGFVCSFAVKVMWDSRDHFPSLGMKCKCSHYQTCSTLSLNRGCVCWEVERQWVCIRQVNLQYEFSLPEIPAAFMMQSSEPGLSCTTWLCSLSHGALAQLMPLGTSMK